MLHVAFLFDTPSSKLGSKPDLKTHGRTIIGSLHTAKVSNGKITKELGGSRAAIRRFIKDPKKHDMDRARNRNSQLSSQDHNNITIHGKRAQRLPEQ